MIKTILMKHFLLFFGFALFLSCSNNSEPSANNNPATQNLYFPPIGSDVWETTTMQSLNWDITKLQDLLDYLALKNSKSFIVLVNGKIVLENYFNGQTASQNWYWASAGKTLTSTLFGIAEQDGFVSRTDKVSKTLGTGWTSEPLAKENLITNLNLLTMTSGLEDIANGDCVLPSCLTYNADASTRWAYHNVYVKLQDVIQAGTGQNFSTYFNTKLRDKIGMTGGWFASGNNIVYASNARSAARFGLFMLNKGKWENNQILNENFFNLATNTSQNLNLSYGYLWWLNGKTSYRLPQSQLQFSGSIIPTAPNDMFMALGKNDQKIYVIPSKKMVVVRMGDAADTASAALSNFDKDLWTKISALIK
jgi:CubicO group peptidase (beta-lactamase class C family)